MCPAATRRRRGRDSAGTAGIASPLARMVTLQKLEKPLNQIANWVLDRVLGKDAA